MRVKRLEIQGFKSFKDKTVIHFDHGITGIVGPNGCGKSNIVDAFFWVMGEQSYKHMRGSGSDDLIFNGSSRYSPLGLAEATMVLETDVVDLEKEPAGATIHDAPVHLRSKEIAVTRRLYRSGEGEYFINGVQARLKDIQELFMDTGVGAKGYSVIEQGQIGKIVNSKPEDRRLLIEEAAGIAKYKARKKESLRKMEAAQANLSRLNDVIVEIERSLGSLERQAQKARQYKKYKDELLDKEMTWGRRKTQVMRQKLGSLQKIKEALEQELVGLRTELQTAETTIEVDRISQLTDSKHAEELQSRIQQRSDELTRERSALDLSRRRQGDLASQLAAFANEKQELEQSISVETARLATRELEGHEAAATLEGAAEGAASQDERVRDLRRLTDEARRRVEGAKRELMNGITRSSDLTSRAASLLSRVEAAAAQAAKLEQQSQTLKERLANAGDEAAKARTAAESVKAELLELRSLQERDSSALRTQEQSLKQLDRERGDSLKKVMQLKSRLQSLEELSEAHEGLADGPKAALDWAQASGAEGALLALADAIEIQAGYDAAAEGWLENRLANLLSGRPETALQALAHVAVQKQGRVSIHIEAAGGAPSLNVATAEAAAKALEAAGFETLGSLSDFVRIDASIPAEMRNVAAGMIGGVRVVRDFGPMAKFLEQGGAAKLAGCSVVSMAGEALDASGNQTVLRGGGAEGDEAASLLKRKRAIADLEVAVAGAESGHQLLEESAIRSQEQLEAARASLHELQTRMQGLQIEAAAHDRDVHQSGRALGDLEQQLESLESDAQQARDDAAQAVTERESIGGRLKEILDARSDLENQVLTGEAELAAHETELRDQEAELQRLRVSEASLRERANGLKRELETARMMISDRQRRMEEIVRTLERASSEREQFSGGESNLAEKIEELTHTLGIAREELSVVKDRLEQSSAKVNGALERIKELHKTGDSKMAEANRLALEVEKISSDVNHLVQNLEEKYGPGCLERPVTSPIQEEMTEPVVTAEMTADEELALGEEVERLRERIRRLGEVNVMAIEEFEALKKRYDYLTGEKQDLEHSIVNLNDAIEHINKTSEERFRKAFEAIADRFERLFPIIFGGGQAKLSLVYPEGSTEILDAGVDILAQPPGKKIVNIGLLSGGEKALTAVSLIFAIFMVKPSPFCVLDEVDAPLDDANIGKFNALLREMSVKSQFIVITHNKKTMELNDTLYGVTMEEPGVSKMVSIEMH